MSAQALAIALAAAGVFYAGKGVVVAAKAVGHGVKVAAVDTAKVVTHPFRHPKKDAKAVAHAVSHPRLVSH